MIGSGGGGIDVTIHVEIEVLLVKIIAITDGVDRDGRHVAAAAVDPVTERAESAAGLGQLARDIQARMPGVLDNQGGGHDRVLGRLPLELPFAQQPSQPLLLPDRGPQDLVQGRAASRMATSLSVSQRRA